MTESPKSQATSSQGLNRRYWPWPWVLSVLAGVFLIGVIVGIVCWQVISVPFVEPVPAPSPPIPKPKLPPPPEVIAKAHLDKAEQEAEQAIEVHLRAIDDFFSQAKKGTGHFAEHALGWYSLYLYAWELIFRDNSHKKYLQDKFSEHIFTPSQLDDAVKQVVQGYLTHVRSIEGKMLVAIRADVADYPETYPQERLDDKILQQSIDQAILQTMGDVNEQAVKWNLVATVGTEAASTIGSILMQNLANRLLMTLAARFLPAALSNLIVPVVGPIVVYVVVDWSLRRIANPEGNFAAQLDKKLDEMNRLIVDELRNRLKEFAKERAVHRRAVVLSLLQSQGGAP